MLINLTKRTRLFLMSDLRFLYKAISDIIQFPFLLMVLEQQIVGLQQEEDFQLSGDLVSLTFLREHNLHQTDTSRHLWIGPHSCQKLP